MAGSINCGALAVSGQGGDSVIRAIQNISEFSNFPDQEKQTQSIGETVTVQVT